jgi:S-adenosylhomocysteine hydrolase
MADEPSHEVRDVSQTDGRLGKRFEIPKLPLLGSLSTFWDEVEFTNTVLVGIQHLLASTAPLMSKLEEAGLGYNRMFLLGKVYSSNPQSAEALKRLGISVHPGSLKLNRVTLFEDYRIQLRRAAADLIATANEQLQFQPKPRRLLVLDSGGTLIGLVNRHRANIDAEVVAVEQTRSGARAIRDLTKPLFPVINVAESRAKLRHESPYIASAIIDKIRVELQKLPTEMDLIPLKALVVGAGAVGMEVAKQLTNKVAELTVYDPDDERVAVARKTGLLTSGLQAGLSRSQLIIGCVGKSWLPKNSERHIRDGAILVSGSSSNVEFLGLRLLDGRDEDGFKLVHCSYPVKVPNGTAWILNAGFPVDFDGSPAPIPLHIIQYTMALMLAGAYQAIDGSSKRPGLLGLDERLQGFLIREAQHRRII